MDEASLAYDYPRRLTGGCGAEQGQVWTLSPDAPEIEPWSQPWSQLAPVKATVGRMLGDPLVFTDGGDREEATGSGERKEEGDYSLPAQMPRRSGFPGRDMPSLLQR